MRNTKCLHRLQSAIRLIALTAAVTTPFAISPLLAADYPSQQIRVVVPLPPGSAPDFLTRIFSASLQQQWGQTVLVENRPGAAQNLGAEIVARAAPDGYTLMTSPPPPVALNKFLYSNIKFDPDKFTAVTVICAAPNVLVVRDNLPAKTLAEFTELARTTKGGLTYGSTGSGSTLHLTAEATKTRLGVEMVHVPYKGAAEVLTELLAGRIDFAYVNLMDAWPHVSAGKLRALAVGSEKRDPALPDLPSISEVWPGLVSTTWFAVVAPPETPKEIAEKLSDGVRAAFTAPDAAKRLADLHATPVLSSPVDAAKMIRDDSERWGAFIKANNIKGD